MTVNISAFRDRIIPFVPGCPLPLIDQTIIEAARAFCDDTFCIVRTFGAIGSLSASSTVFTYTFTFSFGASAGTENIIRILLDNYTELAGVDIIMPTYCEIDSSCYNLEHADPDSATAEVSSLVRSGTKLYRLLTPRVIELFPFTADESDVSVLLKIAVKPGLTATTLDDVFWNEYRKAVMAWSVNYLVGLPKRPWTDYQAAEAKLAEYVREVGRFKIIFAQDRFPTQRIVTGGYF